MIVCSGLDFSDVAVAGVVDSGLDVVEIGGVVVVNGDRPSLAGDCRPDQKASGLRSFAMTDVGAFSFAWLPASPARDALRRGPGGLRIRGGARNDNSGARIVTSPP